MLTAWLELGSVSTLPGRDKILVMFVNLLAMHVSNMALHNNDLATTGVNSNGSVIPVSSLTLSPWQFLLPLPKLWKRFWYISVKSSDARQFASPSKMYYSYQGLPKTSGTIKLR